MNSNNASRSKNNQNIQVYVRLRPINDRERIIRSTEVVSVSSPKEVMVKSLNDGRTTKKFTFDRTFGPESTQTDVYQYVVHPLIEEVLAGYNCTVFAYGQTGTGKTHTMVGEETPMIGSSWDDFTEIGIIPRALSHLFDELRLMEVEFSMRISFLELYNEELSDLLSSTDSTQIRIYDDVNKKGSIIVNGLEEIPVHSTGDVYKLLAKGQEKRKTASTLMNAQSSRSHTIFSILVHIKENGHDGEELVKIGKLNLVDLAGSENVSKAGNEKGIRTRESVNINQSLLTLGRVITALVERTPHIPYRESKLTRLLQESLGGRTKTSIIATISPGCKDAEETLSTLEYAHRAKNIQNKPEINQKLFKKTVLKAYTEEIDRLKRDLIAARDKNGIYLPEETYQDMTYRIEMQNKELNEKMMLMKALKDDLASKIRLFNEVSLNLVEKTEELNVAQVDLADTRQELGDTKEVLYSTKQKYKEKKQLLKNHMKTEEVLSSQAKELLSTASEASNDTYRLHESIERRNKTDHEILSTCDNFTKMLNQQMNVMNDQVRQLENNNESQMQAIHREVLNNKIQHDKFTNEVSLKIKLLSESNENSRNDYEKLLGKYQNILKELSSEQENSVKQMVKEIIEKQQCHTNNLIGMFAMYTTALDKQKGNLCESHLNMFQQVNQISLNVNSFCDKQKSNLEKLSLNIKDEIEKNCHLLNASANKNESVQKEVSNVEMELQKLALKLQNLRTDSETNNESIKHISSNLAALCDNVKKDEENTIVDVESNRETFNESTNNFTITLNNHKLVIEKDLETNKGYFSESEKIVETNLDTLNVDLNKIESNIANQTQNTKTQQTEFFDAIQIIDQKRAEHESNSVVHVLQKILDESDRQNQHNVELTGQNNVLEGNVREYTTQMNNCILDCLSKLDNFKSNEIQTYRPTGETPAKKVFNYPTNLVETSPHERIIKRFWNQHNKFSDPDSSMVFSELDEDTILEDSINTPIAMSSTREISQNETIPLQEKQINIIDNSEITAATPKSIKSDYFAISNRENKENNSKDKKLPIQEK